MNREVGKYLLDIIASIKLIEQHLMEVPTLSDYKNSIKTIDAVERRLAIIGEALKKADRLEPQLVISNKARIIGLRNILTHDYDLIENETIWVICKKYLPILQLELEILL